MSKTIEDLVVIFETETAKPDYPGWAEKKRAGIRAVVAALRDEICGNINSNQPAAEAWAVFEEILAPAPDVCEWTQGGWEYRRVGCWGWFYNVSGRYVPKDNKCHLCGKPIKFTEAQR